MPTPRVAAIHDMSGFGRCSLTVAIPVLSAMGVQCCPLPTAYLSTHTGGFTGYTFLDMTDELPKTAAHWAELGIHFDAVYTGFMGSEAQMDLAADFVRAFRRDRSTIFICDPVMGDHGKIYKTYTPAMCAGMTRLAELADVIVPNLTEAAVLLGEDHSFGALTHDEAGYRSVVERLSRNGMRSVVLTGVMLRRAAGRSFFSTRSSARSFTAPATCSRACSPARSSRAKRCTRRCGSRRPSCASAPFRPCRRTYRPARAWTSSRSSGSCTRAYKRKNGKDVSCETSFPLFCGCGQRASSAVTVSASQSPLNSSMRPSSVRAASCGSMGICASSGMPCFFAASALLPSPKR